MDLSLARRLGMFIGLILVMLFYPDLVAKAVSFGYFLFLLFHEMGK